MSATTRIQERDAMLAAREGIEAKASARGGYTRAQLADWGVAWPPPRNWKRSLVREHALQIMAGERSA